MLKLLIVFTCSCIGASNAESAPSPTTFKIVNTCNEAVWLTSDPQIDDDLKVEAGASKTVSIPDFFVGQFWFKGGCVHTAASKSPFVKESTVCTIGEKKLKINKKETHIGDTRFIFGNVRPAFYYIDVDYGVSYGITIIPADDMTKVDGETHCDTLVSNQFNCGLEDLGTDIGKVNLAGSRNQCFSPCAALHDESTYMTSANFQNTDKVKAAIKKYCSPDPDAAVDLKKTNFYINQMHTGQKLNTVNTVEPKNVAATCKSTSYTIVVSCLKEERIRVNPNNVGPFFSYPFFYSLP